MTGEAGVGKTAFLRHLAHHPRAASFKDGIVYLSARHQSPADVLQLIFEAFYDSEQTCKPTEADIRRTLQNKQALILLDDVQMAQHDLEHVLDIAPQSAFVVATRTRCLWGEVRAVPLDGLPAECALQLLERDMERPLGARRSARRRTRSARSSAGTPSESCRPRPSPATSQTRSTPGREGCRRRRSSGS